MKIGNKAIWKYIHGGEWKEREVIIVTLLLVTLAVASINSAIKYESYMFSYPYGSDTPEGNALKGHGDTIITLYPLVNYAVIDYGSFQQRGFYEETDKEIIIYTGFDSVQPVCKLKNGDIGMQIVGNMMMSFRNI